MENNQTKLPNEAEMALISVEQEIENITERGLNTSFNETIWEDRRTLERRLGIIYASLDFLVSSLGLNRDRIALASQDKRSELLRDSNIHTLFEKNRVHCDRILHMLHDSFIDIFKERNVHDIKISENNGTNTLMLSHFALPGASPIPPFIFIDIKKGGICTADHEQFVFECRYHKVNRYVTTAEIPYTFTFNAKYKIGENQSINYEKKEVIVAANAIIQFLEAEGNKF